MSAETGWPFEVNKISWGLRPQFKELLNNLSQEPALQPDTRAYSIITRTFGEFLTGQPDEIVALEALRCITDRMKWLLNFAELFQDWMDLGLLITRQHYSSGLKFFQGWNGDLHIEDPGEMQRLLQALREVKRRATAKVVVAFLEGYPRIRSILSWNKIPDFIEHGVAIKKEDIAEDFFMLRTRSASKIASTLSRHVLLADVSSRLEHILLATSGSHITVRDLTELDSDELIDKGSSLVCLYDRLCLPARCGVYDTSKENEKYYLLSAYLAGVALSIGAFPAVHGRSQARDSGQFLASRGVRNDLFSRDIFLILDVIRLRTYIEKHYPALFSRMQDFVQREFTLLPDRVREQGMTCLLYTGICGRGLPECPDLTELCSFASSLVSRCDDCKDVAGVVGTYAEFLSAKAPGLVRTGGTPAKMAFYSDYTYTAQFDTGSSGQAVEYEPPFEKTDDHEESIPSTVHRAQKDEAGSTENEGFEDSIAVARYVYDEWSHTDQDYLRDWCFLQEIAPPAEGYSQSDSTSGVKQRDKIKQIFERLKPDLHHLHKYLLDGDRIDTESLIRFVVESKANLYPEPRFYARTYPEERDLCVALLLDISGSTADKNGESPVLELEKRAADILAGGLCTLGDKFGMFGFSGDGRKRCRFHIYKDFDEAWETQTRHRLLGATPDNSTRMGVAIRHATRKLETVDTLRKLLIVITDGKPMDTDGYCPVSLYAQYDVRKACEEALRRGISTFGLVTCEDDDSRLDIMFPGNRFLVTGDIETLASRLSLFYLQLTT